MTTEGVREELRNGSFPQSIFSVAMTDNSKSTITVPSHKLEELHRVHGEYQKYPAKIALHETLSDALELLSERAPTKE